MSQELNTLLNTFNWFKIGRPEPSHQDTLAQLGVHFEEVKEMLDELTPNDTETAMALEKARFAIGELANRLKQCAKIYDPEQEINDGVFVLEADKIRYFDAICDQIVTVTGAAWNLQANLIGGLGEVNRSNYSKFGADGKPIYDENHKIIKGPNYRKADLEAFITF